MEAGFFVFGRERKENRRILDVEMTEPERQAWMAGAPSRFSQTLQFKGFGGGVPQNTETAAVKPRVGIE